MLKRLFVCYSRRDARAVAGLVALLRVTGAPVFRDEDSIAPGLHWRAAITEALSDADAVIVFWSAHAASSEEVRAEYDAAIAGGRTVIPVLLDHVPLCRTLEPYQGLDFSELFLPHEPDALRLHSRRLARALLSRIFPEPDARSLMALLLEPGPP